jgi:hypothetical protein
MMYHQAEAAGWNAAIDGKPYKNPYSSVTAGPVKVVDVDALNVRIELPDVTHNGDSIREAYWAKGYLEALLKR